MLFGSVLVEEVMPSNAHSIMSSPVPVKKSQ